MTTTVKKIIRLSSYAILVSVSAFLAHFPFLKKDAEYSTTYTPGIPHAHADIRPVYEIQTHGGDSDDDDDGSL